MCDVDTRLHDNQTARSDIRQTHTQTGRSVLDSLISSLRKYVIKYTNYVPNIRQQNPILLRNTNTVGSKL